MSAWRCGICRTEFRGPARVCPACRDDIQGRLFDIDRPGSYRATDPLPSRKAAAAGLVARQSQKREILRRLSAGPLTARDLRDVTGDQQNRVSKRLGELVTAGLVREFGYEQGPHNRWLTRYALTDAGRRDLELIGVAS